jgi:NAD(P)H-dependent FMN reductase
VTRARCPNQGHDLQHRASGSWLSAAAIVSYGATSGIRAAKQLRLILAELQIATVRAQVTLDSYRDVEDYYDFKPTEQHVDALNSMLTQVISWGTALSSVRG